MRRMSRAGTAAEEKGGDARMSFDEPTDADRHELRIRNCTSCSARIVFLENPSTGRTVPVDAETVEASDQAFDSSRHASHFRSCPNASKHSRKR